MSTTTQTDRMLELDARIEDAGNLRIRLLLDSPSKRVFLEVTDKKGGNVEVDFVEVAGKDATFAYNHPFTFLAISSSGDLSPEPSSSSPFSED